MKKLHFWVIILFIVILSSCEKDDDNYKDAPEDPTQNELLNLVNQARTTGCNCGDEYYPPVDEVKWNSQLEEAAQNHSNDMYEKNYFDHTGKDGSSAGDRIERTGYSWNTYGENIAMGYSSEKDVIEGWLKSTGHCKNIMNKQFTEMGVATKGEYWTQVFAKPSNLASR